MSEEVETVVEPPPEPAVVAAAEPPPDAEAQADAAEANALEIPTGEKLVPLSALTAVRGKLREAKAQMGDVESVKAELARTKQEAAALAPYADAFRAMQAAQQAQPPAQAAEPAPDTAEVEALARDLDFYKPDGTLDVDRATRMQAMIDRRAAQQAAQSVAPIVQQTARDRAAQNVQMAIKTVHPQTKQGADPAILNALVGQIANQPGGMEMLANPEAVKQVWLNAYALTTLQGTGAAPVAAVTPTVPVVSDRSGGNAVVGTAPTLSSAEKKAAKEAGLSETEYMKIASKMPW